MTRSFLPLLPPSRGPLMADAPTVLILAGGLGTRLRSVVNDRPKVLAEVGGRPFLAYWLETLAVQGFQNVVVCAGYLSDHIERCFGDRFGTLKLQYSVESSPLGTGGAIRQAISKVTGPDMLILNGDSYCEVDLPEFWRDSARRRFSAAMALHYCSDTRRFGRVTFAGDGRVENFLEKSDLMRAGWINAGVYRLPVDWFRELGEGQSLSLERDLLPGWITNGIYGFPSHGRFIDIGLPETLAQAGDFFAASRRVAA